MAELREGSGVLSNLATRPPTPPKEAHTAKKWTGRLDNISSPAALVQSHSLLTPPANSPSSSTESAEQDCGRRKSKKKVDFSPWTNYHKAPTFSRSGLANESTPLRSLPPSRERKASSSILKIGEWVESASPTAVWKRDGQDPDPQTLSSIVESLVQQLAGTDHTSRFEAYTALTSALKADERVIESSLFPSKGGLIAQFIQRDVSAASPTADLTTVTIALQALKLLSTLLCKSDLSRQLSSEFKNFTVEEALRVIQEGRHGKAFVSHHMHVMSVQRFDTRIWTDDRAGRLITCLSHISERIKGNSILSEKTAILQRLLATTRGVMISRADLWLRDLFLALLSSTKDIRTRAFAFGIEAAKELGQNPQVAQKAKEVLDRQTDRGTLFSVMEQKLLEMLRSRDDAAFVPQGWSVVILFLRSRPGELERWRHLKPWLLIIQKCFNSSDMSVKLQANVAWNRMIYALDLKETTGRDMIQMLKQPIIGQLNRKESDKNAEKSRKIASSTLCSLLYYSFRPTASYAQLDLYWDSYVDPIITKCLAPTANRPQLAYHILIGLLGGFEPKAWNSNRANENGVIKPEELPRISPKWIRERFQKVVSRVMSVLRSSPGCKNAPGESLSERLWTTLLTNLAEAGKKEVEISHHQSLALEQVRRATQESIDLMSSKNTSGSFELNCMLLRQVLSILGVSSFELAGSLSTRNSNGFPNAMSIIHDLLQGLAYCEEEITNESSFVQELKLLLEVYLRHESSLNICLEFLELCLPSQPGIRPAVRNATWRAIASAASSSFERLIDASPAKEPEHLLLTTSRLCTLFAFGYSMKKPDHWALVGALSELLDTCDKKDLSMIRRTLIERLCDQTAPALKANHDLWTFARTLLRLNYFGEPSDTPVTEANVLLNNKSLLLCASLLEVAYIELTPYDELKKIFDKLRRMVNTCTTDQALAFWETCGCAIRTFMHDPQGKLSKNRNVQCQAAKIWLATLKMLKSLEPSSYTLDRLESILCCGFESDQMTILQRTEAFWNDIFRDPEDLQYYLEYDSEYDVENELEYPEQLQEALGEVWRELNLNLPNFPEYVKVGPSGRRRTISGNADIFASDSELLIPRMLPRRRSLPSTPSRRTRLSRHAKTAPVIDRQDSQIEFMQITSSPRNVEALRSQLTQDHANHARDDQKTEAASIFPDLRATPKQKRPASRDQPTPFKISSDLPLSQRAEDEPSTPKLTPQKNGTADQELVSSPTPRRGSTDLPTHTLRQDRQEFLTRNIEALQELPEGPPSSPPQLIEKSVEPLVGSAKFTAIEGDDEVRNNKSTMEVVAGDEQEQPVEESPNETSKVATSIESQLLAESERASNSQRQTQEPSPPPSSPLGVTHPTNAPCIQPPVPQDPEEKENMIDAKTLPTPSPNDQTLVRKFMSPLREGSARLRRWSPFGNFQRRLSQRRDEAGSLSQQTDSTRSFSEQSGSFSPGLPSSLPDSQSSEKNQTLVKQPLKRKRGRLPASSKQAPRQTTIAFSQESTPVEEPVPVPEQPPKKKRGRPSKADIAERARLAEEAAQQQVNLIDLTATKEQVSQKKNDSSPILPRIETRLRNKRRRVTESEGSSQETASTSGASETSRGGRPRKIAKIAATVPQTSMVTRRSQRTSSQTVQTGPEQGDSLTSEPQTSVVTSDPKQEEQCETQSTCETNEIDQQPLIDPTASNTSSSGSQNQDVLHANNQDDGPPEQPAAVLPQSLPAPVSAEPFRESDNARGDDEDTAAQFAQCTSTKPQSAPQPQSSGLLVELRKLQANVTDTSLSPVEVREIDDILFHIRRRVFRLEQS